MNKNSYSNSYKDAGVDVTAGYKAVELMKQYVGRTVTKGVLDGIGGFGGLFELDMTGIERPVLVSGTDGVGTKIKIAFLLDKHDTVGIDCVAMCVNEIICCGAKPQFFLDYIACGRNIPEKIANIVSGVAEGCVQAGCALVGGETAEHPGLMPEDEYDLAGFSVGVVDKSRILKPDTQKAGDVMIAIKSSGVHSNGFSLVRKVFDVNEKNLAVRYDELGATLGETLLTPTRIYVKAVMALQEKVNVKAISHITGGGFYENIPRALPKGISAQIRRSDVQVLPIFDVIAKTGNIPERDMFNTFNMGVGMTVVVDRYDADKAIAAIKAAGEEAYVLGELINSDMGVVIC
ncbi:MAG: phosphoribosylformylglycinamidine cyclo-ligase [Ruminococcus sp.]|nr:phosphoribosylformylglycinamidine cyclo-ligase [Ruminococcus sp.]